MKTTYEKSVDAAYIFLKPNINFGEVKKTVLAEGKAFINLDFDQDNRLVGIEILSASRTLSSEVLKQAARIDK
ncbi:MAG: DUF2283 domain-containing protein [Candidatus Shapirobacteria bacterium]|jgi:uncharacterized protein YuzE